MIGRPSLAMFAIFAAALAPALAASDPRGSSFFASKLSDQVLLKRLQNSEPLRFEPVGRTSIAFRMPLKATTTAAYKVASRFLPRAPFAEVAAYRVASLLGLDNVPPAVLRRISRAQINAGLGPKYQEQWRDLQHEVQWLDGGIAEGAASLWVFGLRSSGLEERQDSWRPWLRGDTAIPKGRVALARDLSNMVVFDYLVGNSDRFADDQMLVLPGAGRLVMVDHDHAFPAVADDGTHSVFLLESLKLTKRFSRSTIGRLRALKKSDLRAAVGAPPRPLLTSAQIDATMARRAVLLSLVTKLVEARGQNAVLYFD